MPSTRARRAALVGLTMKPVGKPDAGNPHVRFDERGGETGLRHRHENRAPPRLHKRAGRSRPSCHCLRRSRLVVALADALRDHAAEIVFLLHDDRAAADISSLVDVAAAADLDAVVVPTAIAAHLGADRAVAVPAAVAAGAEFDALGRGRGGAEDTKAKSEGKVLHRSISQGFRLVQTQRFNARSVPGVAFSWVRSMLKLDEY